MPSKPWETRRAYSRKVAELDPRTKILLVCEGTKTEPNYFKRFPVDKEVVDIQVEGGANNTDTLLEHAIQMMQRAIDVKRPYNQVWCVFDRDSFTAQNFNRALQLAAANRIKVAYSNEAFELWYLLHFAYHDTPISRDRYCKMLTDRLERPYAKNDANMYNDLLPKQADAIRNATTLLSKYVRCNPVHDNPSTTVHHLVEALRKFAPEE